MLSNDEIVMQAVRDACPDPELDCLEDEDQCFRRHPVHAAVITDGVIEEVFADVAGLAEIILVALGRSGRLRS